MAECHKFHDTLTDEEKVEIDLTAEMMVKTIQRRQELGISQRVLERTAIKTNKIFEKMPLK